MKVTHKLVVTEPADEVREKMRQALAAAGALGVSDEDGTLWAEVNSGRHAVGVEIDFETTAHGTQLTLRTRDRGHWSQPARKVLREVQDQFWSRDGMPFRSSRSHRKRKKKEFWRDPLTIAAVIAAVVAIGFILWLR